jgi:hypothetical protein
MKRLLLPYMKRLLLPLFVQVLLTALVSAQGTGVRFTSSDTALQNAFSWAKAMALHYQSKGGDPVGPWYESALPPRSAFCMRDVSHQSIGAEILGMHRENRNMFTLFVTNISASKDWCSYWEMDKYNRPSPSDYRSDREFWYNLNANFDLMDACWRLFLWTGDSLYLNHPAFLHFYAKTAGEYIVKWALQPDSLLTRPAYPNAPVLFRVDDAFDRCRGLPSYSEGIPNLKMGIDLVAALYRGLTSYAAILQANGQAQASAGDGKEAAGYGKAAAGYGKEAAVYRDHIDADWWDTGASLYNTHYTNDHQFGKAEGETFLLWFDALADTAHRRRTIEHLQTLDLNMENQSYLPLQYYRNNYWAQARALLLHISSPATQRREYPEVSFGVIEAFVQGLMGVEANALTRTVSTLYRSAGSDRSQLSGLPVLNTTLNLTHFSSARSAIANTGKHPFKWKALFAGDYERAFVNKGSGRKKDSGRKLEKERDGEGRVISYLEMEVAPGEQINIQVR